MLVQISAAEMLERTNKGDKIYMLIPIDKDTKIEALAQAETYVIDKNNASDERRIEKAVVQEKPETPEKPKMSKRIDTGKLRSLYRAGWEPKKIADELGCSMATVYAYTKKLDKGEEI